MSRVDDKPKPTTSEPSEDPSTPAGQSLYDETHERLMQAGMRGFERLIAELKKKGQTS
ncbi:MAG TPA: hypothetical protein VLA96_04010 [Terriglobales bacterium]|nr:hypothetical protein [Terriglobales bacterium]